MKRQSVLKEKHRAFLQDADSTKFPAVFECFDDSTINFDKPCRLVLTYEDKELVAGASDFFGALEVVRLQLEPEGIIPLVNGARRTCYPSGMSRDMGMGLSVYCLRMNMPTTMDDLVGTFENTAWNEVTTVAEQKAFFLQWRSSIRKRE